MGATIYGHAARSGEQLPALSANDYARAVQSLIDSTASARGYADGVACLSYSSSTNLAWRAEAVAFMAWRDAVWAYCYGVLGDVQAGRQTQPTIASLLAGLPSMNWPA